LTLQQIAVQLPPFVIGAAGVAKRQASTRDWGDAVLRQMRAATLTSYVEVARFVGLDPFEMLRNAGINAGDLSDPENRIAARSVVNLLEESAGRSGCPSFGLLMAECRTFAQFGPLSLLLERLANVREVVLAIMQYRRHVNDILDIAMKDDGTTCLIQFNIMPEYADIQIVSLTVARGYRNISGASGGRWTPACAHFTHAAPDDLSVYRRCFPFDLEFECDFNGLSCQSSEMELPNPLANEEMAQHARRLLNLVSLNAEHAPVSDAVRRSIALFLPSGGATLDHVAANLGLTTRSLQRNLERESQVFAGLLNETRRELARRYLATSSHSITTISDLTGYASSSAFTRWFHSEFGMSPQNWRTEWSRAGDHHRARIAR